MGSDRKISTYDFKVLHEQVADDDLFEDKTHEKLAASLDRLIHSEEQGITIGLEGSWGSGKSTVISLLKKSLADGNSEKILFFMFDAWAHDGDPLRKIFLEKLIDTVDQNGDDKVLSSLKLKVSARKKTVEVNTHKRASKLGKWLSILALLVPFGVALLSAQNYENISMPWSAGATDANWYFVIGMIAVLAPLIFVFYWRLWGGRNEGENMWDFFASSGTESYTQDVTEDGERTSIEFERFFSRIMSHLLCDQRKYDKAIIVIDNLDRVDSNHAKNIWATLQTFFQHRSIPSSGSKDAWVNKLWFIVPFDREGLSHIWELNSAPSNSKKVDTNELSSSFFNKCFQIISYVPRPVISGWVSYLNNCISNSLIGWPESEQKNVLEVIQRYIAKTRGTPTPRQIQLLVNQIGYLGLQWGSSISSEAICLYSLFRQEYSENGLRQELLHSGLPYEMQPLGDINDVKAEIAGLLFGVEKNKGIQLLLGPEIEKALQAGSPKQIAEIITFHQCAFWVAWEGNVGSWLPGIAHSEEYRIAFTQAMTGMGDHIDKLSKTITSLAKVWSDTKDKWQLEKIDYSPTLKNFISIAPSNSELISSIKSVARSHSITIINSENLESTEDDHLTNVSKLLGLLRDLKQPLQEQAYPKLKTTRWQKWLDLLDKSEILMPEILPPTGTIGWMVDSCQFDQATPNNEHLSYLIRTFNIYQSSKEWDERIDQILGWLKVQNRNPNNQDYYRLVLLLSKVKTDQMFPKVTDSFKAEEFWQSCSSAEGGALTYISLFAAIAFEEETQSSKSVTQAVKDFWKSDQSDEIVAWLYQTLRSIDKLYVLWLLAKDNQNILAIKIIRTNNTSELYSLPEATNDIDEYLWLADDELRGYVEKLCLHGSFEANQSTMEGRPLTYHKVFRAFYEYGDNHAREFIRSEMTKMTKEDWLKHLKNASSLLSCLDNKSLNFSRALSEYLTKIVTGEEKNSKDAFWDKLEFLINHAMDVETTLLPDLASSYFCAEGDFLSDKQFSKLSSLIEGHLQDIDPTKYMVRLTQWIENDKNERVAWLAGSRFTETKAPLEVLSVVIRNKFSSYDGEFQQVLLKLSEKIGLSLLDASEESESETQT